MLSFWEEPSAEDEGAAADEPETATADLEPAIKDPPGTDAEEGEPAVAGDVAQFAKSAIVELDDDVFAAEPRLDVVYVDQTEPIPSSTLTFRVAVGSPCKVHTHACPAQPRPRAARCALGRVRLFRARSLSFGGPAVQAPSGGLAAPRVVAGDRQCQGPGRGPRRWSEAMAPEGNRPGPRVEHKKPALAWR